MSAIMGCIHVCNSEDRYTFSCWGVCSSRELMHEKLWRREIKVRKERKETVLHQPQKKY